jgi:hypothetical protein
MSNARPRVLVVGPGHSAFFMHLLTSIAGGFAAQGCAVAMRAGRQDPEMIGAWAKSNGVSIVFDINQMIRDGGGWSPSILYASWLESAYWYDDEDRYYIAANESADWSYFLFNPANFGNQVPKTRPWSVLSPGVTARTVFIPKTFPRSDISFAGYIPLKNYSDLKVARKATGEIIRLEEFLTHCPPEIHEQSTFSIERTREVLAEVCLKLDCTLDPSAYHTFENNVARAYERSRMMKAAIDTTTSVSIYGPDYWEDWEEFSPFYKGFIGEPKDLDLLYATSRINLHNGTLNLHFRVFDCLAAGGFMLMLRSPQDDKPGELESVLQPGEHYGNFSISDVGDVMKRYLDDPAERNRIAQEGCRLVLEKHTWTHRVESIMSDLGFDTAKEPLIAPTHLADIIDHNLQASVTAAFSTGG